ncbi:hypothetical protein SOASR014_16960 [Pectobacterium carotovorum subsp. carotovorum]|nr:hypothetical protein SOASR014_16960 [Pectobacterium carotovorum subsp. carotovorum]GLX43531.1 hypothetical protein Pcaca01_11990 [Pectobacterium carotovorum subsp. carotovorum]
MDNVGGNNTPYNLRVKAGWVACSSLHRDEQATEEFTVSAQTSAMHYFCGTIGSQAK